MPDSHHHDYDFIVWYANGRSHGNIALASLTPVESARTKSERVGSVKQGHGEHTAINPALETFTRITERLQVRCHNEHGTSLVTEPPVAILKTKCKLAFLRLGEDVYLARLTIAYRRRFLSPSNNLFNGFTLDFTICK